MVSEGGTKFFLLFITLGKIVSCLRSCGQCEIVMYETEPKAASAAFIFQLTLSRFGLELNGEVK